MLCGTGLQVAKKAFRICADTIAQKRTALGLGNSGVGSGPEKAEEKRTYQKRHWLYNVRFSHLSEIWKYEKQFSGRLLPSGACMSQQLKTSFDSTREMI